MNATAYLRTALLTLVPLAAFPLCGPVSCNRGCPDRGNPCELIPPGKDIETGECVYPPANGAACNFSAVGDGTCYEGACVSAECDGIEFFQGCDDPMSGGFEGACIANFCASVAPIDECVKEGVGRINCCSQAGCAAGQYATQCLEPLHGVPCDPTNLEPPGIEGQMGTCDAGVCVPNPGEACEGVRCAPSSNFCFRNDLEFATCQCQDWPVDGQPPCPGGVCLSGGTCFIPGGCQTDCSDDDPCTRDFCDAATAINGSCGPDGTDCCVNIPEPAGSVCELPGSPGQFGYCSHEGLCEAGPARNELSMGCTDNLDATVKLFPFELQLSPLNQRVPGSSVSSMTVDGVVYLSQTYLDRLQYVVTGGTDKVDVRGIRATAMIHYGATGSDVILTEESIPYTCALGASVPCDPANDLGGIAGHRGNTDCTPVGAWNTCGRFVSLPISADCDPGGVCSTGDWNGVRAGQCASNGFCITDRVGLALQDATTLYQPNRNGYVFWGWDDQNTGATVQSGGPNDGTWLLPSADYSSSLGPNGARLIFFNSVSGTSSDLALECTMGVDSQSRYGVYSADPLASPTPLGLPTGGPANRYSSYEDPLLSVFAVFPTGLLTSSDVCLHVDPDATLLTPSSLCDVDDADGAHSFEIHHEDAACSGPLDLDFTQTSPIDPGGNFGLDAILADHFDGNLVLGSSLTESKAIGTARSDSASCSTSWTAYAQSVPIPEGTVCDWTNTPCALECSSGTCSQECSGAYVQCEMKCPGGSCAQSCDFAASCTMDCASDHDCSASCGGTPCVDPGECKLLECPANSASCNAIDSPNGTSCDFGHPVPGTCSGGTCTTAYGGYVEASTFDPPGQSTFLMNTFSGGGYCCFETPIEAQLAYPSLFTYVDPSLCDSYIDYVDPPTDLRLRLDFVTGGGWCCGNTVADVLAAYPTREICDGRPQF